MVFVTAKCHRSSHVHVGHSQWWNSQRGCQNAWQTVLIFGSWCFCMMSCASQKIIHTKLQSIFVITKCTSRSTCNYILANSNNTLVMIGMTVTKAAFTQIRFLSKGTFSFCFSLLFKMYTQNKDFGIWRPKWRLRKWSKWKCSCKRRRRILEWLRRPMSADSHMINWPSCATY